MQGYVGERLLSFSECKLCFVHLRHLITMEIVCDPSSDNVSHALLFIMYAVQTSKAQW